MTPEEFVIWLKGFAAAANSYNVTPQQWETVTETLATVKSVPTTTGVKPYSTSPTVVFSTTTVPNGTTVTTTPGAGYGITATL